MYDLRSIDRTLEIVLGALYLPGAPRSHETPRSKWRAVCGCLRRAGSVLEGAPGDLRRCGLWSEAISLEAPGLLAWAEALEENGRLLSAASPRFPERWLTARISVPPAFYRSGEIPEGPYIGIVGSRSITPGARAFARDVGKEATRLGYCVVSGGAAGCDRAAAVGAGSSLLIRPFGLSTVPRVSRDERHCYLSAQPLEAEFTTAAAMERNALIYAASEATVVVQARFKAGGAWTGATEALRRKLTRVLVREEPNDMASRALMALGAFPLKAPLDLSQALALSERQPALFRLTANV